MLARSGTEDAEQSALFCWLALQRVPAMRLAFAIPNGGKRDKITAAKLKATGVKAGVPDIMLPVAMGDFHGLFIELKRQASFKTGKRGALIIDRAAGTASDAQDGWLDDLRGQGYRVAVCEGWLSAAREITDYLDHE
jgi:DNA mismatch repair ATPase MutS